MSQEKPKVLIFESDKASQQGLKIFLENKGFAPVMIESLEELESVLQTSEITLFAAILAGCLSRTYTSNQDGQEALAQLHEHQPELPVVTYLFQGQLYDEHNQVIFEATKGVTGSLFQIVSFLSYLRSEGAEE